MPSVHSSSERQEIRDIILFGLRNRGTYQCLLKSVSIQINNFCSILKRNAIFSPGKNCIIGSCHSEFRRKVQLLLFLLDNVQSKNEFSEKKILVERDCPRVTL